MAPNLSLTFKKVPVGMPIAGQDIAVEDIGFDEANSPPKGGIITENLYCSFDPYLRGRMRGTSNKSYVGGFVEGKPISTQTLAKILKSDHPDFKEGTTIIAMLPVQQYSVLEAETIKNSMIRPLDLESGPKDIRNWLGALGMPGLTAYSSLYAIGKPKKGEVIFISSAAGAVGQIVGQLAKREGLKVIGSAGSDEKCKLCVEQLGFDECWNYKKTSAAEALDKYCPDGKSEDCFGRGYLTNSCSGIDIYYDNVGGEQLDAALERMKKYGRLVECGMISGYNDNHPSERYGVKNLMNVIIKSLTLRGFIVSDEDMMVYYPEHQKNVSAWLNDGSLKTALHESVGMKEAANACIGVLKGENFGKAVLKIKV